MLRILDIKAFIACEVHRKRLMGFMYEGYSYIKFARKIDYEYDYGLFLMR